MPGANKSFVLVLLSVSLAAGAEGAFDPAARAKAIAPFIDDETILVCHADLRRIDVKAAFAVLEKILGGPGAPDVAEMAKKLPVAEKFVSDMIKAGATDAYGVLSIADIPSAGLMVVVPLNPGANERAIKGLLHSGKADTPAERLNRPGSGIPVHTMRGAVVVCDKRALGRIKAMQPVARPEIAKAFAAAGDTAFQLLLVPTEDSRRVIEAVMPNLPGRFGGGPVTAVTRGLMWAAIGVNSPPTMSLQAYAQSQDQASAKALTALVPKATALVLSKARKAGESRETLAAAKSVMGMLKPEIQGSSLVLNLDGDQVERIVVDLLAPSLRKARMLARWQIAMTALMPVGVALCSYADGNEGRFPPDLQALVEAKYIPASLLVSPISGKKSYIYIRPKDGAKLQHNDVIVYDDPAVHKQGETVLLCVDTHTERVKVDKRFYDRIKKKPAKKPEK